MSGSAHRHRALTVEEYLRREETATLRHEYVAGELYAMSGATPRHNRIAANVLVHLRAAARGGPCRVYMSDVKLRVADDVVYYPDVMVDCAPGGDPALLVTTPGVVVEVLSPGTATTDRREKLAAYRRIPSLETYLLVEQDRRRVTRHWRDADGGWGHAVLDGAGVIPIARPAVDLTLAAIYEDVSLPPLGVAERVAEMA